MFKKLFSRQKNERKEAGAVVSTPQGQEAIDQPDEEFQLLSLHRGDFTLTPELLRRREEEALRKKYNIAPSKIGKFV
jgi:hypothetical protein